MSDWNYNQVVNAVSSNRANNGGIQGNQIMNQSSMNGNQQRYGGSQQYVDYNQPQGGSRQHNASQQYNNGSEQHSSGSQQYKCVSQQYNGGSQQGSGSQQSIGFQPQFNDTPQQAYNGTQQAYNGNTTNQMNGYQGQNSYNNAANVYAHNGPYTSGNNAPGTNGGFNNGQNEILKGGSAFNGGSNNHMKHNIDGASVGVNDVGGCFNVASFNNAGSNAVKDSSFVNGKNQGWDPEQQYTEQGYQINPGKDPRSVWSTGEQQNGGFNGKRGNRGSQPAYSQQQPYDTMSGQQSQHGGQQSQQGVQQQGNGSYQSGNSGKGGCEHQQSYPRGGAEQSHQGGNQQDNQQNNQQDNRQWCQHGGQQHPNEWTANNSQMNGLAQNNLQYQNQQSNQQGQNQGQQQSQQQQQCGPPQRAENHNDGGGNGNNDIEGSSEQQGGAEVSGATQNQALNLIRYLLNKLRDPRNADDAPLLSSNHDADDATRYNTQDTNARPDDGYKNFYRGDNYSNNEGDDYSNQGENYRTGYSGIGNRGHYPSREGREGYYGHDRDPYGPSGFNCGMPGRGDNNRTNDYDDYHYRGDNYRYHGYDGGRGDREQHRNIYNSDHRGRRDGVDDRFFNRDNYNNRDGYFHRGDIGFISKGYANFHPSDRSHDLTPRGGRYSTENDPYDHRDSRGRYPDSRDGGRPGNDGRYDGRGGNDGRYGGGCFSDGRNIRFDDSSVRHPDGGRYNDRYDGFGGRSNNRPGGMRHTEPSNSGRYDRDRFDDRPHGKKVAPPHFLSGAYHKSRSDGKRGKRGSTQELPECYAASLGTQGRRVSAFDVVCEDYNCRESESTCIMLRNLPNRFTPQQILNVIFINDFILNDSYLKDILYDGPSLVGLEQLGDFQIILEKLVDEHDSVKKTSNETNFQSKTTITEITDQDNKIDKSGNKLLSPTTSEKMEETSVNLISGNYDNIEKSNADNQNRQFTVVGDTCLSDANDSETRLEDPENSKCTKDTGEFIKDDPHDTGKDVLRGGRKRTDTEEENRIRQYLELYSMDNCETPELEKNLRIRIVKSARKIQEENARKIEEDIQLFQDKQDGSEKEDQMSKGDDPLGNCPEATCCHSTGSGESHENINNIISGQSTKNDKKNSHAPMTKNENTAGNAKKGSENAQKKGSESAQDSCQENTDKTVGENAQDEKRHDDSMAGKGGSTKTAEESEDAAGKNATLITDDISSDHYVSYDNTKIAKSSVVVWADRSIDDFDRLVAHERKEVFGCGLRPSVHYRGNYKILQEAHEQLLRSFSWKDMWQERNGRVYNTIIENAALNTITGPWLSSCRTKLVRGVGEALDPRVAQFIDYFCFPRNFSGINMGYGFVRFRCPHIAKRWRIIMQGKHFPGNSKKKLLALHVTEGIVPDYEGFRNEIRLHMRHRFWFDHETFQAIVVSLNEKNHSARH